MLLREALCMQHGLGEERREPESAPGWGVLGNTETPSGED